MGQSGSIEEQRLYTAVQKLSKLEFKDLEAVFKELSSKSDSGQSIIKQPTWLNRDHFAKILGTNALFVEQLFEIFDRDQNGVVDAQEFITGMALCLHGNIKDKCSLLFQIFNLNGDEGISPEELSTMLTVCLQSANSLLEKTLKLEGLMEDEMTGNRESQALMISVVVDKIVKDAFVKCDISRNGKLEIDEFAQWVHKHPKLMNGLLTLQCPRLSNQNGDAGLLNQEKADSSKVDPNHASTTTTIETLTNESRLQDLFSHQGNSSEAQSFFDSFEPNPPPSSSKHEQSYHPSESSLGIHTSNTAVNIEQYINPVSTESNNFSEPTTLLSMAQSAEESSYYGNNNITESCEQSSNLMEHNFNREISDKPSDKSNHDWHPLGSDVASGTLLTNDFTKNVSGDNVTIATEVSSQELKKSTSLEVGVEPSLNDTEESLQDHETSLYTFWPVDSKLEQYLAKKKLNNESELTYLTQPTILIEQLMGDPVNELVAKYLGEHEAAKRPFPTYNTVEKTAKGLKLLLEKKCWRGAIDFTRDYLLENGEQLISTNDVAKEPMMTPSLMQIWYIRIALLVKMRMFSLAEAELNGFNDLNGPDLYYQFYPNRYPGKKGSIVPFSFHLLYAELPQHNGRPNIALDRLYALQAVVVSIQENLKKGLLEDGGKNDSFNDEEIDEIKKLWNSRYVLILYALGNCFFGMKEFNIAVRLYKEILHYEPEKKLAIYSAIGRIYLQLGDIPTADRYFNDVDKICNNDPKASAISSMNRGYQYLADNDYKTAYEYFMATVKHNRENLAAINNAAVCLLFNGKVKEASQLLERMVWEFPNKSLHEDILFNLDTIYELETSRSLQKKYKILDLVSKNIGDGFFTQCLKLAERLIQ